MWSKCCRLVGRGGEGGFNLGEAGGGLDIRCISLASN